MVLRHTQYTRFANGDIILKYYRCFNNILCFKLSVTCFQVFYFTLGVVFCNQALLFSNDTHVLTTSILICNEYTAIPYTAGNGKNIINKIHVKILLFVCCCFLFLCVCVCFVGFFVFFCFFVHCRLLKQYTLEWPLLMKKGHKSQHYTRALPVLAQQSWSVIVGVFLLSLLFFVFVFVLILFFCKFCPQNQQ